MPGACPVHFSKLVKHNLVGLYHSPLVLEFLGGRESARFVLGPVPHSLGKGARGALVDRPIKTVCNRGAGAGKNGSPKEECVVSPPKGS